MLTHPIKYIFIRILKTIKDNSTSNSFNDEPAKRNAFFFSSTNLFVARSNNETQEEEEEEEVVVLEIVDEASAKL